jgi:hypothetical protein
MFLRDNQSDSDFSAFMSIWFYEEQKHALVLMEYLRRFRPELVPSEAELQAVRFPFDPAPALETLMLHFCGEIRLNHWYRRAAEWHTEPVIKKIYELISRDEARHGGAYLRFMKRAIERGGAEVKRSFAKIGVLMASSSRTRKPLHEDAVLRALGWHGVAMVEFRIRADGEPVFMEVNGRFWNSLALAVYAGADFPAMLVEMAERGDVKSRRDYRTGVRCRWMLGDLRHLMEVWRGAPAAFPGEYPGRLRATSDFIMPVAGTHHDNFTFADPMPELGDWIDFFLRRIPARLRKRAETRKELHIERRYSHS